MCTISWPSIAALIMRPNDVEEKEGGGGGGLICTIPQYATAILLIVVSARSPQWMIAMLLRTV